VKAAAFPEKFASVVVKLTRIGGLAVENTVWLFRQNRELLMESEGQSMRGFP